MTSLDYREMAATQELVAANQLLLQQLNTGAHSPAEIRQLLTKITNHRIDDSVEIRLPFHSDFGRNIHLGKHVFINSGAMLTDMGGIYIADDVLICPNVTIVSVNHPLHPADRHKIELQPVYLHHNAWIGAGATILPGVTVGENAVVGAGAVVTHSIPKNTVAVGTPARVVKIIK